MKRALNLVLVLSLAPWFTQPTWAAETLTIIKEKSKVEFVGWKVDAQGKRTEEKHNGGFKAVSGEVKLGEPVENSSLKMTIDATSLWADADKLTDHLKNPDFFNVREFPTITFESSKLEPMGKGQGTLTGKLTMLGKTVETKVPVESKKTDGGMQLTAKFKIDRTLWGMKYGEGKIDKEVDLVAELILQK